MWSHAIGLSDKAETRELFLPYYKGFMYDGLASFDEQSARAWLAEGRIIAFDPKQLKIERVACTTVTLDSLKLEPIFIKLDVRYMRFMFCAAERKQSDDTSQFS